MTIIKTVCSRPIYSITFLPGIKIKYFYMHNCRMFYLNKVLVLDQPWGSNHAAFLDPDWAVKSTSSQVLPTESGARQGIAPVSPDVVITKIVCYSATMKVNINTAGTLVGRDSWNTETWSKNLKTTAQI